MAIQQSTYEQFQKDWTQRASVAMSKGIPYSSIEPVVQYDYQRVSQGSYPMSNLEAYAAIQTSHTGQVPTPTPSQPSNPVSSFLGHLSGDVQEIATGIFHAPQTLYDLGQEATNRGITNLSHPGQTIKSLTQSRPITPLESQVAKFIPGEQDIVNALTPAGRSYESQHPLLDLIDLAGAGRFLRGAASDALALTPDTNIEVGQVADTPVAKAASTAYSQDATTQAAHIQSLLDNIKPIDDGSFKPSSPNVTPIPDLSQPDANLTLYNILNSKSPLTQLAKRQLKYGTGVVGKVGQSVDQSLDRLLGPQGAWGGRIEQYIRPFNIMRRMGQKELETRKAQLTEVFQHLTPEESRQVDRIAHTANPDGTFIDLNSIESDPNISPNVKQAYRAYSHLVDEFNQESQRVGHTVEITNPKDGRKDIVATGSEAEKLISTHDRNTTKYLAAVDQLNTLTQSLSEHVSKVKADGYHLPDGTRTTIANIITQLRSQLAGSDSRTALFTEGASKEAIRGATSRVRGLIAEGGVFDKFNEAMESGDVDKIKQAITKLKVSTASKFLQANPEIKLLRQYLDDLSKSIKEITTPANGRKLANARLLVAKRAKAVERSLAAIDKKWDRVTADKYENIIKNIVLGKLKDKASLLHAEYQITPEQFSDIMDLLNAGELNPVGLAPFIKESEMAAIKRSALSSYQEIVDQGGKPIWVPKVSAKQSKSFDRIQLGSETVKKTNQMFSRSINMSYAIENPAVGLTFAWKQLIERKYTEEYIEKHVVPKLRTAHSFENEAQGVWRNLKAKLESQGLPVPSYPEFKDHNYLDHVQVFNPKEFLHPDTRLTNLYKNKVQYIISKTDLKLLQNLVKGNHNELNSLWDGATNVFRMSVLGASPRFGVHILVGGTFLLLGQTGLDVLQYTNQAYRMVRDGEVPAFISTGVSESGLKGELYDPATFHQYLGGATQGRLYAESIARSLKLDKAQAVVEAYQSFLHHISDIQRTMAYLYGKDKAELEGPKLTQAELDDAERYGLSPYEYEGMKLANKTLADLDARTPLERSIIKFAMPFGSWTKHIIRYSIKFPLDHPLRANLVSQLSQQAYEENQSGMPAYLFHLFYLGHPDANGNVSVIDIRQWNPLRDVANYMTLGGILGTLNPLAQGFAQALGVDTASGTPELYPQLTYNAFYGTNQAATTPGNTALSILQAYIPEYGILDHYLKLSSYTKSIAKYDPRAYSAQLADSLNFPWLPQTINPDQILVKQEDDRLNELKAMATNALTTGDVTAINANPEALFPYNGWYFTANQLKDLVAEAQQWDLTHSSTLPASSLLQIPSSPKLPSLAPVPGG